MKSDSADYDPLNLFRVMALGISVAGALGSLDLTLKAGQNNKSFLLVALFVAWVESSFIGCMAANIASKYWSFLARVTLYILMVFLTLVSLVVYSGIFSSPRVKPAAVFLIVPLLSWILIVGVYLTINFGKKRNIKT
jgi:hypothetical protein